MSFCLKNTTRQPFMFHSGILSKKTPRLRNKDRRTEYAEGQKDILLNFIALALCSFLVSKLRQKYISTGFLFCLYSHRVSLFMFILAFCLKKNTTPGKRGQKDIMCRMTEVYFIVFHCVSFMFLCHSV